ncbi:hypothetical protein C8R43DRAFT_1000912 [Mycena crocata]|nr:hypothetical protein C8R43DRAFT_1000912 [Mycena crocata]
MAAVRKKVERILNRKAQATENAAEAPVEEPGLDSEAPSLIPAFGFGVDPGFGDAGNETDDAAADPMHSYISRLPAELLWEILICRHLSGTADRACQRQPHNIPIHLAQICSAWRQVALNTSELWSNVSLYFNHQTAQSTGKLINFAAAWLSRGRPGGLALDINMGRMYDSDDNRIDKEPIRNLIVSRAGDWQKLAFKNAPNNMARLITSIPDKLFISLEEIEIDVYSSVWDQWCFDTLLSLPLLRRVRFRTWRTSSSIHNFSLLLLPWSQLKELSLSVPVSGEELFSILPACSNMETLDADIFADMPENIASREITLPRLSQLSLSMFPAEEKTLNPFLRALRAPVLRDLNLDFVGDVTYHFYRCAFWASHSHQLHKFSLSNLYVHDPCSLLRTMPNLRSLALSPRDILSKQDQVYLNNER